MIWLMVQGGLLWGGFLSVGVLNTFCCVHLGSNALSFRLFANNRRLFALASITSDLYYTPIIMPCKEKLAICPNANMVK
jgi:hypothetical protein